MKDKAAFANEAVVEAYLDSLLSEPEGAQQDALIIEDETEQKLKSASDLLATAQVLLPKIEQNEAPPKLPEPVPAKSNDKEISIEAENQIEPDLRAKLDKRFQALYFDVAGLTLAVPLIELGGIHQITEISPFPGRPEWFAGIMLKNDEKLQVVDSARWVMPEKLNPQMLETINYRYVVQLGKTPWGLLCENLITTVELDQDDIKWRMQTGKRPWLAGMVKQKMCALINVEQLVEMLASGLNNQ